MLSTQPLVGPAGTAPPRTRGPTPAAWPTRWRGHCPLTERGDVAPIRAHLDAEEVVRPLQRRLGHVVGGCDRRPGRGSGPPSSADGFVGLCIPDREDASRAAGDDVTPVGSEVGRDGPKSNGPGKIGHLGRGGEAGIPHQRRLVVDRAGDAEQVPSGENAMPATPARVACDDSVNTSSAPRPMMRHTLIVPARLAVASRVASGLQSRSTSPAMSGRENSSLAGRRARRRRRRCRWPSRSTPRRGSTPRTSAIGCVEGQPPLAAGDVDHGRSLSRGDRHHRPSRIE